MEIMKENESSSRLSLSSNKSSSKDEILEQLSLIEPYSNKSFASRGNEFDICTTENNNRISLEMPGKRFELIVSDKILYFKFHLKVV